jgi:hypothetical protein
MAAVGAEFGVTTGGDAGPAAVDGDEEAPPPPPQAAIRSEHAAAASSRARDLVEHRPPDDFRDSSAQLFFGVVVIVRVSKCQPRKGARQSAFVSLLACGRTPEEPGQIRRRLAFSEETGQID